MDSYDIFRKLTVGVKFRTNKTKAVLTSNVIPKSENQLCKDEVKLEVPGESLNKQVDTEHFSFLNSMPSEPVIKSKKRTKEFSEEKKKKLLEESINQYRNSHNISVVGRHIPPPVESFNELPISKAILENIAKCGYTEPTNIQKQAIPIILQRRQLLACAPTGSGKTAAFLVPIIESLDVPKKDGIRALIITPTRELAKQTQRECDLLSQSRGLRVHYVNKVKSTPDQPMPKLPSKIDILVTTPNRLCFFLNQEVPGISLSNVQWLVIDEADKLFETGVRGFRDQLAKILEACSNENRRIVMFSATHTPAVAYWCRHNMRGLITLTVGQRNAAADTLDQKLLFVGNEAGKLIAIRDMVRKGLKPPVLIFVQSKDRAQQLFSELLYDGLNVDVIHADRTQVQRDNTVRAFREGCVWMLICTELMARGIDFKGVHLVINYDFPPSGISYVHRVGRAGRAGLPGAAVTFFTTEDTVNLRSIAQILKQSGCDVPSYMLAMKKRGKKQRKQLQISAPKREDITSSIGSRKRKKTNPKAKKNTTEASQTGSQLGNLQKGKKNMKVKRKITNENNNKAVKRKRLSIPKK